MRIVAATVAGALALTSGVNAWWDVGHGIGGAIAKMMMTSPSARSNLDNILSYLQYIYNDQSSGRAGVFNDSVTDVDRPAMISNNLANAAIWPDVVKGFYNVKFADDWHYTNLKYDPDNLGCTDVTTLENIDNDKNNGQMYVIMSNFANYLDSYKGRTTAHWYLNFVVNFFSHMLQDMHMPYHAVGRCIIFDGKVTQDLGGNRWTIYYNGTKTNLHAFWDSAATSWGNTIQQAVIDNDPDYSKIAAQVVAQPDVQLSVLNQVDGWNTDLAADKASIGTKVNIRNFNNRMKIYIGESRDLAAQGYIRAGNVIGATVDDAYQQWAFTMSKKRVVLSGYRMAALFDSMLDNTFLGLPVPRFVSPGSTNCGQLQLGPDYTSGCTNIAENNVCRVTCVSGGQSSLFTCKRDPKQGILLYTGSAPRCTPQPPLRPTFCDAGVYGRIPVNGQRPANPNLAYCPPQGGRIARRMLVQCSAQGVLNFVCIY